MDVAMRLQTIASRQGWAMVRGHDGSARIEVRTEYGRTQVVNITLGHDPDRRPLAWIWSVVCQTSAVGDPYYLLRLNADLPYGALAVRDPNVILVESQLVETADDEELMRAVYYVGKYADDLEKQVHGNVDKN